VIARSRIGIVRQQARMALGDMEHDRACLEQGEITFLIGRNLAERMKRLMARVPSSHGTKQGEPHRVGKLL
jgi:hypothetical protein